MSAFKQLFTEMIRAGGDESKVDKDLRRQMLKVYVKETHPHFLVSDSFFYVPAYFSQAAANEFKNKHSNVNASDLEGKVILITNWSLEMRRVNSAECFTSYAGVEVRLIVHSFKPQFGDSVHPSRHPSNLFRDDEFKTVVQSFRHSQLQAGASAAKDMAPLAGGKGSVAQGIVAAAKGDGWSFREGSTKTVSIVAAPAKRAAASHSAAKVKGGASGKRAAKAAGKASKSAAKSAVESVMKFTPKKAAAAKGKQSAKRSVSKKAMRTPSGKKSLTTTDKMTMKTFKEFLAIHGKSKKKAALGKRSAGKVSKK